MWSETCADKGEKATVYLTFSAARLLSPGELRDGRDMILSMAGMPFRGTIVTIIE
ncbi:MAG: hypothetical protein KatS3mg110_0269 [Pirellulaceae bacterium]|nr:MAG: hypothetical protein KatS3mg110_0269 [Pirellulaceae bacterium]